MIKKIYRLVKSSNYYNRPLLQIVATAIRDIDYPVLKYLLNLKTCKILNNTESVILDNLQFIAILLKSNLSDWLYEQSKLSSNVILSENSMNYSFCTEDPMSGGQYEEDNLYILKRNDLKYIYYNFCYYNQDQYHNTGFLDLRIYNSSKDTKICNFISDINNSLFMYKNFDCPKVLIDIIISYAVSFKDEYRNKNEVDSNTVGTLNTYNLISFEYKKL